ncbi:MAG: beta-propeller domain-containing protein, partial [Clostridia bacterium]|nr:beta-propeller domain-containing protein [Clostridia bacterium]
MNKERMLFALGEIDDKYIKEAEPKPMAQRNRIIAVAVSLALVVALSLYLFIPFRDAVSDLSDYESSAYYPLIETIDDYYLSLRNQTSYKNYFEYYTDQLGGLFAPMKDAVGGAAPDMAPGAPENNMAGVPDGGTGEYVESTDNQVEGVIESDLMKMTDKYIFRLGYRIDKGENRKYSSVITVLRVYSIDKEETALVSEIDIPTFEDESSSGYDLHEMYLSTDCDTITILKEYRSSEYSQTRLGVIALDVTDVTSITERSKVSIDGSLNTSRLVNGKLILITDYSVAKSRVDYDLPETFVPTVDSGDGREAIGMDDVIYPEEISSTQYTVVTMMDSENLEIFGTKALLNFTSDVYVSKNHLFLSREYTEKNENESYRKSDIAVLDYTGEELVDRGIITARGWTEDQYSFDEKDGYLRIVTSTNDTVERNDEGNIGLSIKNSASLYIFDLKDNSLAYKVEDFAPQGESVSAVRFDGDSCYVCTAVVVNFTDPVFFFDLSDYEHITY